MTPLRPLQLVPILLSILALPGTSFTAFADTGVDSRLPWSADSPDWLRAVGVLRVPGVRYREGHSRHHREDCSATLVASGPGRDADTIVTAWHCLEFHRDLSRPITFTLLQGMGKPLVSDARRLADGGGMHADWALLRLERPIPVERVAAIAVLPSRADPRRVISMAGYSRDEGLGDRGSRLTWDPACEITRQELGVSDSDCIAYRGASGGAVVQLSDSGEPRLAGVISQGDGNGLSIYVPVSGFRSDLMRFLR